MRTEEDLKLTSKVFCTTKLHVTKALWLFFCIGSLIGNPMGSLFGAAVLFAEPSTLVSNHPLKNLMAQGEIHFLPGEAKLRGAFTWDVPEEDNEASFVLYPNRYLARQNTGVQPDREILEGFGSEIANYELSNLNNHGSLVVERVELGSGPERE